MVYILYVEMNKISYVLYQISYLGNKIFYIGYILYTNSGIKDNILDISFAILDI